MVEAMSLSASTAAPTAAAMGAAFNCHTQVIVRDVEGVKQTCFCIGSQALAEELNTKRPKVVAPHAQHLHAVICFEQLCHHEHIGSIDPLLGEVEGLCPGKATGSESKVCKSNCCYLSLP